MSSIVSASVAQLSNFESDAFETSAGKLTIYYIGHASLVFEFKGKTIYADPWSKLADYSKFPKADLILITHQHYDHLDSTALENIYKSNTTIYWTQE